MADNVVVTAGSGTTVAADEVVDGTLGTVKVQYVKIMDGALDASGKVGGDATNGLDVDVTRVSGNVTVVQATASNLNANAAQSGTWTVQPGNTANTTAWLVGHGKTIKSVTGTVNSDTDIVAAVASKRIKVIAYSLISASTTANVITMQSNATGALWTIPLQAVTGTICGANLSIAAPGFLFATAAGEKLTLDVSAAQNVTYSVTYFDDDAT